MPDTQQARVSFSILDGLGTRASTTFYAMLDPTKTIGDLAQAVADLETLVNNVIRGEIVSGSATLMVGGAGSADPNSRVEQNALFQFAVPTSGRTHGVAIPALGDDKITAGRVDMTEGNDPDLLADAITGNVVSSVGPVTVGIWTSSDFLALGDLLAAELSFRKHRRQLGRESRQVGPA
jgi:hypothetical protein